MQYKVIATDFDGTLLSDDKKVSLYNEKTLLQKKKEGTLVIGATARNINSIKSVLNINMFNYLIINNGAYVYDCDKSKGYYEAYISNDICRKLIEEENNGIDFCTKDIYYKYNIKDVKKENFIKKVESFDEVEDKVLKINIYVKNQDNIESVLGNITSKYELNGILMQDSNDDYKWISLTPKNINKKETLKKVLSKHNLSLDDVIYFGDSTNDKELITESKFGIAMINAIPSLKDIADDVTNYDNNNSGVGKYLNK